VKLAASLNGDFISKNEPCVSTKQISASIYPVAAKVVIERYGAADHLRGLVHREADVTALPAQNANCRQPALVSRAVGLSLAISHAFVGSS
jgi:hypothetical protein